jgi:hypothetical protein
MCMWLLCPPQENRRRYARQEGRRSEKRPSDFDDSLAPEETIFKKRCFDWDD